VSNASPCDADGRAMLDEIGLSDPGDLFAHLPPSIRIGGLLDFPGPYTEPELRRHLARISAGDLHTANAVCFAGGGVYDHFSPAIVDWVIQRGEFLTSYTSYQAEISQGFLTAMYEFQTLVCELYGLDVSNASLYDAGTGLAEAALLATQATKRSRVVVAGAVNPRYLRCVRTAADDEMLELLTVVPHRGGAVDMAALKAALDDSVACVLIQQPSFLGTIADIAAVSDLAHSVGAKSVVCADPIAMGVLESPGACGADIAVGEGQSLGIPMGFGGPGLGRLAVRKDRVRMIPGRGVGRTVDLDGKPGYVLTLQTREQHIRRERATSNICSNQGLCALAATVYLCAMGSRGLRRAASLCVVRTNELRQAAKDAGLTPLYDGPCVKEFATRSPIPVADLQKAMGARGYILGGDVSEVTGVENSLLLCATEQRTTEEIAGFAAALKEVL